MRRILPGDLLAAARLLLAVPSDARAVEARRLIVETHAAHKIAKRLRRMHPRWGDGSLMSRAGLDPMPPDMSEPALIEALSVFLVQLLRWRREQAGRQAAWPVCNRRGPGTGRLYRFLP